MHCQCYTVLEQLSKHSACLHPLLCKHEMSYSWNETGHLIGYNNCLASVECKFVIFTVMFNEYWKHCCLKTDWHCTVNNKMVLLVFKVCLLIAV
jgi:hypothetical protein